MEIDEFNARDIPTLELEIILMKIVGISMKNSPTEISLFPVKIFLVLIKFPFLS
jgi:hypothetical protein